MWITLGLIGLDQLSTLLSSGSGTDDNSNTGDVLGNQGNTQLTNLSVGEVAGEGLLIGVVTTIDSPLASLDDLGSSSSSDTGGEDILRTVVTSHDALDNGLQHLLGLTQGGDLLAGHCINARQGVCGIMEANGSICAQLGDRLINYLDSQAVYGIVTVENALK